MKIVRKNIDSTSVASMIWDDDTLEVKFQSGGHYIYDGVPMKAMWNVVTAESIGVAFHQIIKQGGFTYERLD